MNLPHLQSTQAKTKPNAIGPRTMRQLASPTMTSGGRKTGEDLAVDLLFGTTAPRPEPSNSWRTLEAQRKNLLHLPYQRLTQIAIDLSPEVNKGLHDFLRFVNPGIILRNENPAAELATKELIMCLNRHYGSFRSHIDSMWSGVFLGGAVFSELVLDEGGMLPIDIVFNDPYTGCFTREKHPVRGSVWRLHQETYYGRSYMDDNPLIKYIGFDKLADNPYGRPIVGPAIHSSVFLLGLIMDLQRAVSRMGMSRMDYQIDAEQLLNIIDRNPDIAGDDEATAQFVTEQIEQVKSVIQGLEIDEDYVHMDTVQVNYASNPMTTNLNGIATAINTLQNNVVNGYKGISALINLLDSTTETHIRSQVEYYVSALQSFQDEASDMFQQFFDMANQVRGIQGETEFRFKKQRTMDKVAAADVEEKKTNIVISKVSSNIITPEEGRIEIENFKDELEVTA